MAKMAFQHQAGTAMECLSIPITLQKEAGVDAEGREVMKCGFKIGGGIDQDFRKSPQGYTDNGIYVTEVHEGSPAAKAGLRMHDKILQCNGYDFTMVTHKKADIQWLRKLQQIQDVPLPLLPQRMSGGESRYVWRIVLRNFINSLRPKQIRGNHIGRDYIGNEYYEIAAQPNRGKRTPTRWYDPPKGQDFQDPIPSEWESWLRQRRTQPPTEEEIAKNLATALLKKENAAKIEAKRLAEGGSLPSIPAKGQESFPKYEEFHGGEMEGKRN